MKDLKNFWDQTFSEFQAPQCLRCHSLNALNMYLCKGCENYIDTRFLTPEIHQVTSEITVQSFYQWHPGESDTLSEIAILLKSRHSKWVWEQLTIKLNKICILHSSYFVPIPGHSAAGRHSAYFSKALSHIFKAEHVELITKLNRTFPGGQVGLPQIKQQSLSRAERQHSEIQIHVDFTELKKLPDQSRITLVDDIVTTGFTIQKTAAIIQELRPDIKINSVALFNRKRITEVPD